MMAETIHQEFSPILDSLERVHYGSLMEWGRLSVLPLLGPDQSDLKVKTLETASRDGDLLIQELDSASVSEVTVLNRADQSVFGMDGEELVGARQNRVLNLSVLFPAHEEVTVPVSCIEEGRWAGGGRFRVGKMHNARARARRQAKVSQSIKETGSAHSDQREVWRDVRAKQSSMSVSSHSRDLSKVYEVNKDPLDRYTERFPAQEDQIGGFFFIEGLIGLELFSDHLVFQELYPKILDAYAIEAMEDSVGPIDCLRKASDLERKLAHVNWDRNKIVGIGENWRLDSNLMAASAVSFEDTCVHLTANLRDD